MRLIRALYSSHMMLHCIRSSINLVIYDILHLLYHNMLVHTDAF